MTTGKACKAFGINVEGFHHELLDFVLRMKQNHQLLLRQKKASHLPGKRKVKNGERDGKSELSG